MARNGAESWDAGKHGAALLVAAALLLAGCGGASAVAGSAKRRTDAEGSGAATGYDPPVSFAAGRGTALPPAASDNTSLGGDQDGPAPLALAGTTAFVTTGMSLETVDTRTGAMIADVRPVYQVVDAPVPGFAAGNAASPPLVTAVAGRQTAMVAYLVQLPGRGTTPPSLAIELDLIDPSTGMRRSDALAPVPGQPSDVYGNPDVAFAGSTGDVVVITEGDSDDGYLTEAINLDSGRLLWRNRDFLADATVGGTAVGTVDTTGASDQGANSGTAGVRLAGLDIDTGRTLWLDPSDLSDAQVLPSVGRAALVSGGLWSSGGSFIALLDADTGKVRYLSRDSGGLGGGSPWTCEFDGLSTDVCSADVSQAQAVAIDATSGRVLWQLPERAQNRIAPQVTAAWHGAVYGTTSSGPVVLDARTGKDRNDSPGVAPVLVDADVGVAVSQRGGLETFPATR